METKKKIDTKKTLLLLPLVVVPLLALAFYALGGGKGAEAAPVLARGINTQLPGAKIAKNQPEDKLGFYEQSARDSASLGSGGVAAIASRLGFHAGSAEADQTREINEKLLALDREIARPPAPVKGAVPAGGAGLEPSTLRPDVDRLEQLMKAMKEDKERDPELEQLNGLMQGILDVQHPQRVQERMKLRSELLPDSQFKAVPAVIAEGKRAVQGSTIRLVLQDSMVISGIRVPRGHSVFGACRIMNQRLMLDIKQVRLGNLIIPVDLSVYSLDGMPGIDAPEAMLTGGVAEGSTGAMQNIGLSGFDQSLGVQVAGAGIDAARNMLSRRIKRVKVKLREGMPVLLRNNKAGR